MKILPTLATLSLSLLSPLLFAASLSLPTNAELIALNGQEIKATNPLDLTTGVNQIAFRYQGTYRQGGTQTRFESELIVVSFSADDQDYTLTLPTIRNKRDANNFDQQPQLSITSKQGDLAFTYDVITKPGLQWNRKYLEELALYNQSQQVASVNEFAIPVATATNSQSTIQQEAPTPSTAIKATPTTTSTISTPPAKAESAKAEMATQAVIQPKTIAQDQAEISQMLDYWYSKANDETKAAFKNKINN
ncbi:YccT family protein [Shewanella aestuarii]|uniref:DUF2057 domain-containing protein n=1 Tax=Shewanella aestuarii TaxID=1028752 RepID=A0A6G9QIJ3_9GAMM|nr:DUF2057 domain-containing protein [Shewanella aestuarii]QIR13701.1 DUF2057 domain-containing protein [Shewanella aestuarii]